MPKGATSALACQTRTLQSAGPTSLKGRERALTWRPQQDLRGNVWFARRRRVPLATLADLRSRRPCKDRLSVGTLVRHRRREQASMQKAERTKALYAGSFDPVTRGHLDVLRKALMTFDTVHVAIGTNVRKQRAFSVEESLRLIEQSVI